MLCLFQEVGMQPDTFYCARLLEEAGVFISPGCEDGQKEGTHHIRYYTALKSSMISLNTVKNLAFLHTNKTCFLVNKPWLDKDKYFI